MGDHEGLAWNGGEGYTIIGMGVEDRELRRKASEAEMLASNRREVKTKDFVDEHS